MKTHAARYPRNILTLAVSALLASLALAGEPETAIPIKQASVDGQLDGDKARLVISADLGAWRATARNPSTARPSRIGSRCPATASATRSK